MQQILQSYLRRLTNLSGNNRSLVLLKLVSEQFIDVHAFNYLANNPAFSIIDQLIARKKKIPLCLVQDSRDDFNNVISQKLKRLQRHEKFIYEERGAKDLYIGWPFVKGKFSDGTLVRCPLLFFPVALENEDNEWYLKIREDVNITFNKSFLLAYYYYNQIGVNEELLEKIFDDFDKDSRVFRTSLYQLLKNSAVEINFNQENFVDEIIAFENFLKKDFEDATQSGELKLFPEAVLGIFPQAGSYLVPDYISLLENGKIKDLEDFFYSRSLDEDREEENKSPGAFQFLNKVKEEQTFTPFKMDAFQENALKAIKKGNSMVVQGPPGTGKSQLICNLISDFIARGKRVLLVCQKRAALDVVYKRLDDYELSPFVALVHDFKNDRKLIYDQLHEQIESLYEYKLKNNSLDAIQLERQFLQASRRIDQLTEELEEFKAALFDESECGISVKELYLTSDINGPAIKINQEYKFFNFNDLDTFLRKLKYYAQFHLKFEKSDYPWKERKSFKGFNITDLQTIRKIIDEIPAYQRKMGERLQKLIGYTPALSECEFLLEKEDQVRVFIQLTEDKAVFKYFQHMYEAKESNADPLWLANAERVLMDCYRGEGPEKTLPTGELGKFQEAVQKRLEAKRNIFKWFWWVIFSKDKFLIRRVIAANGLGNNKKGFETLIEKIDSRLNLEHNLLGLRKIKWLQDVPGSYDQVDFQTWFHLQKNALTAKTIFTSLRNFKECFNIQALEYKDLKQKLETLLALFHEIPLKKAGWSVYLTISQINNLLNNEDLARLLHHSVEKDFEDLCEYDKLKSTLEVYEEQVVARLFEESKDSNTEYILQLFQNSLRLAWIEHIEIKYPVLRSVSSIKFQTMESELQQSVKEKLQVSKEILLLKARERTYGEVEYNRLNNRVTYRDLHHQVSKKKRIWPIRKLVSNFEEELFNLLPCWMASPESVSAIFPMKDIFDLVIFDEASQCFVEKGIPAMYRGNQLVIAGDAQQLSPSELYKVRWEEETDIPELEIDSLLDLASKHLMHVQLRGHYRSKNPQLINFSNHHFYNDKLRLLPDQEDINKEEPAIKYIKTEGIWEKNANEAEAEKVVSLLKAILLKHPKKEIGVITFNSMQQNLIQDLIEIYAASEKVEIPDSLFVKNIENVQGDEKDIIIFSTAYAPDKNGKMVMQFGSLNAPKGENRLNVAVTRAREEIYVISSIYPQHLKVENAKNEGPKLLKKYLQYAFDISEGNDPVIQKASSKHNEGWFLKNKFAEITENKPSIELVYDLPFADLAIKKNNRYKGLILTDDELYHQSISVKDPHVYTPFTLSKKKWKFQGFFSRQYWKNREEVEEQLLRFINKSDG